MTKEIITDLSVKSLFDMNLGDKVVITTLRPEDFFTVIGSSTVPADIISVAIKLTK